MKERKEKIPTKTWSVMMLALVIPVIALGSYAIIYVNYMGNLSAAGYIVTDTPEHHTAFYADVVSQSLPASMFAVDSVFPHLVTITSTGFFALFVVVAASLATLFIVSGRITPAMIN